MKEKLEKLKEDVASDMAELYTRFVTLIEAIEEKDREIRRDFEKLKDDETK